MRLDLTTLYLAQFATFTLLTAWVLIMGWRYPAERALRLWGLASAGGCAGLLLLLLRPLLPPWLSINVALAILFGAMWLSWAGTLAQTRRPLAWRRGLLLWLAANIAILALPGASAFGLRALVYGTTYTLFHLLLLYALLARAPDRQRFGHRLAAVFIVLQCLLYGARSLLALTKPALALPTDAAFAWLNLAASWGECGKLLALLFINFESLEMRLHHRAERDPLTALLNRRGFDTQAASRLANPALALLTMDLDHFKQVNDRFGHAAGDEVLVYFAQLLERTLSGYDALIARNGGEEFVVLLTGAGAEHADALAEDVRRAMHHSRIGSARLHVTVSIGVSFHTAAGPAALKALLLEADMALYQAKADGRNCVCSNQPPPAFTLYRPATCPNSHS